MLLHEKVAPTFLCGRARQTLPSAWAQSTLTSRNGAVHWWSSSSSSSVQQPSSSVTPVPAREAALQPLVLRCVGHAARLGSDNQLYGVAVIGSHSVMGLVCDAHCKELVRASFDTLLASGLQTGGPLSQQGVASTAHALEGLVALCSKLGSQVHWKAVGTAALRDCCDPGPVADLVGKHLGAKLQVITAAEEGALSFTGAAADLRPSHGSATDSAVVVDFGGRSCEVVVGQLGTAREQRLKVLSLPMGCVSLAAAHFGGGDAAVQEAVSQAMAPFQEALQDLQGIADDKAPIVLTGGTVTTAAALFLRLPQYESAHVHMSRITSDQLRELASRLQHVSGGDAAGWPGWLSAPRRTTLCHGCWALAHLLDMLAGQGAQAYVSDKDLLDGVMVQWLNEL